MSEEKKIRAIKVKQLDGTYSDQIPIVVSTENVEGLSTELNKKADKTATVSTVAYNSTDKKITKTINGSMTDVVSVSQLKTDLGSMPASDVAAWAKEPNKPSYTVSEITGAVASTEKGAANGVAPLNENSKIDSNYLPSYVDDVLEYLTKSNFPIIGESGKIYVDMSTNLTYRWSGSSYVEISPSLALGETSSTAYRGDRGKVAYDHATDINRLTTAQESGLYKISTTDQGHIASVAAVTKSDITELGIPAQDTTYSPATQSAQGLMSADDKKKLDGIASGAQVNAVTSVAGKTGAVTLSKSDVGLGSAENKSSATIRGEITSANVTNALGYTPCKTLQFVRKSATISVPANSNNSGTINVSTSGYSALGVVGYEINGDYGSTLNMIKCYVSSNTVYWFMRQTGSTAFNGTFAVYVLYVAN